MGTHNLVSTMQLNDGYPQSSVSTMHLAHNFDLPRNIFQSGDAFMRPLRIPVGVAYCLYSEHKPFSV